MENVDIKDTIALPVVNVLIITSVQLPRKFRNKQLKGCGYALTYD